MSRTVFFLVFLFVFSSCIESKQGNFDQIMHELVELNQVIETPPIELSKVITEIKKSVQECVQTFMEFYNKVKDNCKTGNLLISEFKAKIEGDILNAIVQENNANNRIVTNNLAVAKLGKDIKEAKEVLKDSRKRHHKETKDFYKTLQESTNKIIVIKHLENIIVDELLNKPANASFLQVKSIKSKLQDLKALVEKDDDEMFTGVLGAMVSLVTLQNLNDQTILKKILTTLAKLKEKLKIWRTKELKSFKELEKLAKKANQAKLTSLRAMGKLYVEAQSSLIAAKSSLTQLVNIKHLLNVALSRKVKESDNWNKLCADQDRIAHLYNKSYTDLKAAAKHTESLIVNGK